MRNYGIDVLFTIYLSAFVAVALIYISEFDISKSGSFIGFLLLEITLVILIVFRSISISRLSTEGICIEASIDESSVYLFTGTGKVTLSYEFNEIMYTHTISVDESYIRDKKNLNIKIDPTNPNKFIVV